MLRDHVIGDLYEGAVRQDDFLEVLQRTAEAVGANVFHMFSWDPANNCPRFSVYTPASQLDSVIAIYEAYYGALDPRRDLVQRAPAGALVVCQDHITDLDVARSEFYQDYQLPTSGLRYLMGTRLPRPGGSETLLGLLRNKGRKPYTDADRTAAASLIPHLHRAINLWQDAKVLHRDAALGTELMEQLGLALFALDKEGRVVFSNTAGEALLSAGTALRLRHGRLAAPHAPDNDALLAAILRVARSRRGESLALRNATGATHDLFMSIAGIPGQTLTTFGSASVLVTARTRGNAPPVTAQQLHQAFGLTPAEAAVAEALIEGTSPEDYADTKGVSPHTVRYQVRAVLAKTNSRSQVKAVSTMLSILSQKKPG
ncbi:helix-turn-helix transcriptional regulator [Cupriavidus necator]|uniref:Helix-turn-helix transcriptional regulator n=1 Tax=Cupriavidus necator TaxID=106590 RepID=A0A367PBP4_CUPNE|nr:helix-turn-helix transcriptional regulator [Cupriavidus necator]QQX87601.1 helix-turn-helix transcriptional regulator [Cupriavidus necator]RCJ04657.1 helix-turn-helix transcriptional regulator [Cupriavidus necator]